MAIRPSHVDSLLPRAGSQARSLRRSSRSRLKHTAYDFLRANRRRPLLDKLECAPERPTPEPSALDELLDRERWGYVATLLSDFSEKDRRFVELYYARGLLPEEVAAAMRISVKTVYSKKNKIVTRLSAALAETD